MGRGGGGRDTEGKENLKGKQLYPQFFKATGKNILKIKIRGNHGMMQEIHRQLACAHLPPLSGIQSSY